MTTTMNLYPFVLLFLIICQFFFYTSTSSTGCSKPFSCESSVIIVNDTNDHIECSGYASCYQSIALVANGAKQQLILCGGSYSCYNADTILTGSLNYDPSISFDAIICQGYFSCALTSLLSQDYIRCEGSYSCINTHMTYDYLNYAKYESILSATNAHNSTTIRDIVSLFIDCSGNYACAGATLTRFRQVVGLGAYSLTYATIYSNGTDLNITLNGYNAGFDLNIFCDNDMYNDSCVLNCFGNACAGTYFHCKNENDDYNCAFNCEDEETVCPFVCYSSLGGLCYEGGDTDGIDIPWEWDLWLDDVSENQAGLLQSSYDVEYCGEFNYSLYDDNSDHYSSTGALLCDGSIDESVCFNTNHSLINQNASICCRGYISCGYGPGSIDTGARIGDSNTNGVFNAESHIVCNGDSSCEIKTLINSNGYIYCAGSDSCVFSNMYGNNIDRASGYYNNYTAVYCDGKLSCYQSKIYYFRDVYCNAVDSCYLAEISNVGTVYGLAAASLEKSNIYTSGWVINMTVHLRVDYAAKDSKIFCHQNDSCMVICETKYACTNVTFVCNGTCQVECGGSGNKMAFDCPKVIDDTTTTVSATTVTTMATTHTIEPASTTASEEPTSTGGSSFGTVTGDGPMTTHSNSISTTNIRTSTTKVSTFVTSDTAIDVSTTQYIETYSNQTTGSEECMYECKV